jgi:hypothetical protein
MVFTVWTAVVLFLIGCATVVEPEVDHETPPLSILMCYVFRAGGEGPLLPILPGKKLSSGDHYRLYFKSSRDCHVYIYQTDASGQVFRLFPLARFDGVVLDHKNPVKADNDYAVPAGNRFFYLDETIGKERIYLAVSSYRMDRLEALDNRLSEARQTNDATQISAAGKTLVNYLTDRQSSAGVDTKNLSITWEDDESRLPVKGYLFEAQGPEDVHMVEFLHH